MQAPSAVGAKARPPPLNRASTGEPIMAIVSLRSQRITVYDANGGILQAPVSSGQKGRETPAGVFSVLQKDADHYSNLYDNAWMPHMQRLTWSGIALHGGPLPGYPASHGCVRLPFAFARSLFGGTRLGMRVIVAPGDVAPVEIAHPALFSVKSEASALAAARAAAADEAAKKAHQARLAAVTASREAAKAMMPVRVAENLKARAQEQLAAAEAALGSAISDEAKAQAEDAKAKALERIAQLQAQWAAAKAELQPSSMLSRRRGQRLSRPRPCGSRPRRRRKRLGASSSRYRCSSAARPSVFMSGAPFSPSGRARSRSWTLIVRWARMSSPPWSEQMAAPICDGAPSPWTTDVRAPTWSRRGAGRAGGVVKTLTRS